MSQPDDGTLWPRTVSNVWARRLIYMHYVDARCVFPAFILHRNNNNNNNNNDNDNDIITNANINIIATLICCHRRGFWWCTGLKHRWLYAQTNRAINNIRLTFLSHFLFWLFDDGSNHATYISNFNHKSHRNVDVNYAYIYENNLHVLNRHATVGKVRYRCQPNIVNGLVERSSQPSTIQLCSTSSKFYN